MIDICVVLCASISVGGSTIGESEMGSAQAWPAAPHQRRVLEALPITDETDCAARTCAAATSLADVSIYRCAALLVHRPAFCMICIDVLELASAVAPPRLKL